MCEISQKIIQLSGKSYFNKYFEIMFYTKLILCKKLKTYFMQKVEIRKNKRNRNTYIFMCTYPDDLNLD